MNESLRRSVGGSCKLALVVRHLHDPRHVAFGCSRARRNRQDCCLQIAGALQHLVRCFVVGFQNNLTVGAQRYVLFAAVSCSLQQLLAAKTLQKNNE